MTRHAECQRPDMRAINPTLLTVAIIVLLLIPGIAARQARLYPLDSTEGTSAHFRNLSVQPQ